jgi:ribose transport system substrate-binding protein
MRPSPADSQSPIIHQEQQTRTESESHVNTTTTRLRPPQLRRTVAVLCGLALVAAACGGDDDAADSPTTVPVTTAAPDTTDAPDPEPGDSDATPTDSPLNDPYSQQIARLSEVEVDTSDYVAEPPFRIATIVQGPINGWGTIFDVTMDEAMTASGKFDMDARLYVPWGFDIANQASGIEDAISQGLDAIMLTSLSRAGLAASVERATAAGVPVILCMAGAETDEFTAEVSSNMPRMGYDSAKVVAEEMGGSGKVVLIHGIAGVDAAEFWKLGAYAAFEEYPDIEIVAEQNGNWSTADSLEVMRTILVQQPEIDAVWTGGFEMGVGIVDAFQEAGIDVPFIGGTGITNGFLRQALEFDLDFFAVQFPPAGSRECVDTVIDVLEGRTVVKYTDVATLLPGVEAITLENAEDHFLPQFNDDFIGPALHDDEVYANAGF